ncbi:peptide ABC transporter ATP-binding protein [Mycoplasmoides gallisepticum S6]|uniref:Peptide ABC transporter ATP-binding protein n=1 Tax=Mycoplasmoides gallisepticum S6 TaxID=1006581 RepID=A0A0F6CL02_MYCGL|nr:peptide ABC transporter ATP-binding protein [Mycoplasmoides gallisepticum S6]
MILERRRSMSNKKDEQVKTLLDVANLSVVFNSRGSQFTAVDNVSFKVNKGDFFGIIGESGSGKSTIGKTLVRLNKLSGGMINLDGRLIGNKKLSRADKSWLHQNAQMIFQDPMSSLNPIKTVLKLVAEPIMINKMIHKKAKTLYQKITYIKPYFNYVFQAREFDLTNQYQRNYYQKLTDQYQQAINQINNFQLSSSDFTTGYKELVFLLDDWSEKVQSNIELSKKYFSDYKKIIDDYILDYDLKKYDPIDLEFDQAKLNQSNKAKILKYSQPVLDLKEKKVAKKALYKQTIKEFNELYLFRNFSELLSWLTTVESEVKSFKYKMIMANKPLDYVYAGINYYWKKAELKIIKLIKKDKFFEKENLDLLIKKINGHFADIFEPLVSIVINFSVELNQDILKTHKLTNQANTYLDLAKRLFHSIDRELDLKKVNETINQISSLTNLHNYLVDANYLDRSFDQWKNDIYKNFNGLINEINQHKQESKRIVNEKDVDLFNLKKEIKQLNQEISENYQSYQSSNRSDSINQLEQLKKVTLDKKTKRDQAIQDYKNKLPEIYANRNKLTQEVKKLEETYLSTKHQFHKLVKEKIHHLARTNHWHNKDLKILIAAIKLRFKSMDAVDFEHKVTTKDKNIYRNLFLKLPKWLNWIYLFPLRSILIRDKVFDALNQVGLKPEHAYRYPHEFSGGQRQRVVIARALITDPQIVIADEPISALDVSIQAQIVNIMKEMVEKRGVTFLFIAHDLSMVNYACENVIIMHRGKILERGNVDKIFKNPIHPYTKSLMKASPKLSNIHLDLASFDEGFNYYKDYSVINKPSFYQVSDNHEVFCTKEQFDLWVNQKR